MSDMGEMWKEERDSYKKRRDKRLAKRSKEILALRDLGYNVEVKTEFQYRINDEYDLYPINNRWHHLE